MAINLINDQKISNPLQVISKCLDNQVKIQ
jgi:hypothetical protein